MAGYSKPNKFNINDEKNGAEGNITRSNVEGLIEGAALTKSEVNEGATSLKNDYRKHIEKLYNQAVKMINEGTPLDKLPEEVLSGYQEYKKILEETKTQQNEDTPTQGNEELGDDR